MMVLAVNLKYLLLGIPSAVYTAIILIIEIVSSHNKQYHSKTMREDDQDSGSEQLEMIDVSLICPVTSY